MRSTLARCLKAMMAEDERIMLLLAGVGGYGFRELDKKRVFDFDVREQVAVGAAAGMAIEGLLPVLFTIAPFLVERALEQIKIDLCAQRLKVILVSIGASYDYAGEGLTHHCPEDIGILSSIPGINIIVPGSASDFEYNLLQVLTDKEQIPWYFRLSQQTGKFGSVIKVPEPKCLVIAVGPADALVREALDFSSNKFNYYNMSLVRPLDIRTLRSMMCERVLVVEPYFPVLAQEIAAIADYPVWIRSVGVERKFYHSAIYCTMLDIQAGFTAERVKDEYERICDYDDHKVYDA